MISIKIMFRNNLYKLNVLLVSIVEISRIDNVLRVAIDNILEIEEVDSNPLPPGEFGSSP